MAKRRKKRGRGLRGLTLDESTDLARTVYEQCKESQIRSLEATQQARSGRCGSAAQQFGAAEFHLGRAEQAYRGLSREYLGLLREKNRGDLALHRTLENARTGSAIALPVLNACKCKV